MPSFVPRELVQSIPTIAAVEFVGTLANGATRSVDFDVLTGSCEPSQIGAGAAPTANPLIAVGPYLDAFAFADQILALNVFYAISGGQFRQVSTSNVPLNTFANVSGLRITGRYVRVQLSNASGALANVELGVYVRST